MDFALETILILATAFAVGAVLGLALRRRARAHRAASLQNSMAFAPSPAPRSITPPPLPESPAFLAPEEAYASLAPEVVHDAPVDVPSAPAPRRRQAGGLQRTAQQEQAGSQPPSLAAPQGEADDLKRLKGIGPQNERRLNALGIFHISQIAAWSAEEAQWIGAALGFPGRVEREGWVGQAQALLDGTPPSDAPAPRQKR